MGAVAILQTFPHAAQTVQHKAVQRRAEKDAREFCTCTTRRGLGRRHRTSRPMTR